VHCRPTLVGLRGVGKTVLLNKLADIAEKSNFRIAIVDAQEGKTLPEFLLPHERRHAGRADPRDFVFSSL
jgi:molybdopterin-guanine dinucleotide biosynthesis protein